MMTVSPLRRGRQSQQKPCLCLGQHALEGNGGKMVAFIDDDVPVVRDEIVNAILAHQALNHRDVEPSVRLTLTAADLSDILIGNTKKHRKLRNPLLEQRLSVDENQCVAGALRDEIGPENGLADAGWADKDAAIMRKDLARRNALTLSQLALEVDLKWCAITSLIVNRERAAKIGNYAFGISRASAW
jgi:hypothetical protein